MINSKQDKLSILKEIPKTSGISEPLPTLDRTTKYKWEKESGVLHLVNGKTIVNPTLAKSIEYGKEIGAYIVSETVLVKVHNQLLNMEINSKLIYFLGYGTYVGNYSTEKFPVIKLNNELIISTYHNIIFIDKYYVENWMDHYLKCGWAINTTLKELIETKQIPTLE